MPKAVCRETCDVSLVAASMNKKFVFAVLALWFGCGLAHAQTSYVGGAYDPNSPKHTVSGSVVNTVTGEPIPRALVQIMGPLQRSDLTDSQGRFHFEGVPEGRAMFMARKPGYFSSEELSRGGGRPRAPVTITGDVSSLVLKLTPEGLVAGTITGDDDDPLEGAHLLLKRQVISNGRKHWETLGQSTTDENGEFRAANLIPGTYYLVAQAQRPATARAAAEPNLGYAPSYYPGAPDLASASAIQVRAGQTAQLDFRLRSQPNYDVSGVVTGLTPEQRGANIAFLSRSGDLLTPTCASIGTMPVSAPGFRREPTGGAHAAHQRLRSGEIIGRGGRGSGPNRGRCLARRKTAIRRHDFGGAARSGEQSAAVSPRSERQRWLVHTFPGPSRTLRAAGAGKWMGLALGRRRRAEAIPGQWRSHRGGRQEHSQGARERAVENL